MTTLTIPDATYQRLAARAAGQHLTVEALLDRLAAAEPAAVTPPTDGWQAKLAAVQTAASSRADRYPPGFRMDDSRDAMYPDAGR